MKKLYPTLCLLGMFVLSSFNIEDACDYAASNIGYAKNQTQRALDAEEINSARFYAYKALNAIEKSRKQITKCDCDYAGKSIYAGLENLKQATRATSLNDTKVLLRKALLNTTGGLESLEKHEFHDSKYTNDVLTINTKESDNTEKYKEKKLAMKRPEGRELKKKIDKSLVNFQNSLNEVVYSVDCEEAKEFANRIYKNCEQQLLREDLSEAKRYYNLRTKEITQEALEKLDSCETK